MLSVLYALEHLILDNFVAFQLVYHHYPWHKALLLEEFAENETELRQSKYLSNIVEQDHRNIKRVVGPMMGFKSFNTTRRTLRTSEWNHSRLCRKNWWVVR